MTGDSERRSMASRRKFLATTGAAGVAALAGCAGGDGGGGGGSGETTTSGGSGETTTSGGGETTTSGGSSGQLSGTIDIAGSSTVFPLATAMSERFRQDNSQVEINIQSTGSGGGFENFFCPGQTDINNASRPIKEEEQQLCSDNGVEPVELTVATDALTVVANNNSDWVD